MQLTGLEALTASERRIAELAAAGLTNREIVQTLFVTARTVEGHLTHVFNKLDVTNRSALPAALAPPPTQSAVYRNRRRGGAKNPGGLRTLSQGATRRIRQPVGTGPDPTSPYCMAYMAAPARFDTPSFV